MNHAMIDIETLGTAIGSAIVKIGVVSFDERALLHECEWRINLQSCVDIGLTMDPKTIQWWMQRSKEAQEDTFTAGEGTDIKQALDGLRSFIYEEMSERVWSHGATFDIPMLSEAARRAGVEDLLPAYWAARDTRTLYELADVNPKEFMGLGTAHSAIDDARAQALAVIASWDKLKKLEMPIVNIRPISDYTVIPSSIKSDHTMIPSGITK